ncbi:hypothetical protein [Pantoea sp. MT58]|uniref:hypothetical protein n=1 Tax=Pantoea sp. MT58 TaxID=2768165 RepID=UPI00165B7FFD|nr:hypothetical protein [Pantoea sp. MT58]QNQ59749.1 hypothetical protein IAI47_05750 [Pantoea sp. MT58]
MTETTNLAVLEIKPEQAPALYVPNGLDAYLEQIRQQVNEVPDLSTAKGRARVASLAAQVSRSKVAIEKPGRDYLKRLKELPKDVEAELRRWVTECDTLRDEVRRPLTEWEAEQERIAAEKAAEDERLRIEAEQQAAAEALKKQIESDHEMALLLNDKFDRDAAEAKAEAERQRAAHEEEIRRQAAEQARIETEKAAQRERDAAAKREADLQAAKEKAEADAKTAQERAERQAQEAREKAEHEKQAAIEAEQRKAREAEAARLAEEKRIADEAAARAANEKHRKAIGAGIVTALLGHTSLTREQAIEVLVALKDNKIPHTGITY